MSWRLKQHDHKRLYKPSGIEMHCPSNDASLLFHKTIGNLPKEEKEKAFSQIRKAENQAWKRERNYNRAFERWFDFGYKMLDPVLIEKYGKERLQKVYDMLEESMNRWRK